MDYEAIATQRISEKLADLEQLLEKARDALGTRDLVSLEIYLRIIQGQSQNMLADIKVFPKQA